MLKDDLLAGAAGAASYSGLPLRSIYHLAESGQLPVVKLGRRLYFRRTDLDRVFAATPTA